MPGIFLPQNGQIAHCKLDQEKGDGKTGSQRGKLQLKANMKRNAEPERETEDKDVDKSNKHVPSKMESFPVKAVQVDKVKGANSGY